MKMIVISYSLTGNNEALANSVAKELEVEHIKITEPKPRTMGSVFIDMIFNRTPKVEPTPDRLEKYDLILFVGPVWMGHAASPFRAYFEHLKTHPHKYAFATISGGAITTNPKLADDLKKRVGAAPTTLADLYISDLLPPDPKPTMKSTSAYRVNNEDIKKLTDSIIKTVRNGGECPEQGAEMLRK